MRLPIRCLNGRACHRCRELERYLRTSDFTPRIQTVAVIVLLVGGTGDVYEIGAPHETADVGGW